MKKIVLTILVMVGGTAIVLLVARFPTTSQRANWDNYTSKVVLIESTPYDLWVADTPIKHYQGLSFIKSKNELAGKAGMMFEFADQSIQSFVNRNTYVDLDVIWMVDNIVVGRDVLPSLDKNGDKVVIVTSPVAVKQVVELVR